MLLTSSQVSIALSSFIVVIFTAALFLSGYAIQQRTLRDLRDAIKPSRPEPKITLPDRFRKSTTELPDGTIIEIDNHGRAGNRQKRLRGQQYRGGQTGVVVEIRPTLPDEKESRRNSEAIQAKDDNKKAPTPPTTDNKQDDKRQQGTKGENKGRKSPPDSYVQHPEYPEKVVSRAERRRLIKEELRRTEQREGGGGYRRRLG